MKAVWCQELPHRHMLFDVLKESNVSTHRVLTVFIVNKIGHKIQYLPRRELHKT